MDIINSYEGLPKIAKIILQIFFGGLIGGVYRIITFINTKSVKTLVAGILCFVPLVTFIFWIADLISEITNNKITFCID